MAAKGAPVFPPQHGAWAFLGLPIILGAMVGGVTPLSVLLGIGFIVAYPASYFAIAILRYPRPQRFRKGLWIWGSTGAVIAVLLIAARPWLLWVGLVYAIAFAVNLAFARAHNERSLLNDAVFILECVAIVPIMWAINAGTTALTPPPFVDAPTTLWTLTAFAALALVGSTMHVRSLIRERSNPRFRMSSQVFAGVSLIISVALAYPYGLWALLGTAVAFGFLLVRSLLLGRRPMKPGIIGVFELVGFILVAIAGGLCAV